MLLQSLLLQDESRDSSNILRKPWYRRAMSATAMCLWKQHPNTSSRSNKRPAITAAAAGETFCGGSHQPQQQQQYWKLRKCSSLRIAASFSHVCLCAPVSLPSTSTTTMVPPRMSSGGSSGCSPKPAEAAAAKGGAKQLRRCRTSVDGRERPMLFLGKSLLQDVLMRQLSTELVRGRRGEMEVVKRRVAAFARRRRRRPGPSRLSRTSASLAGENDTEQLVT